MLQMQSEGGIMFCQSGRYWRNSTYDRRGSRNARTWNCLCHYV